MNATASRLLIVLLALGARTTEAAGRLEHVSLLFDGSSEPYTLSGPPIQVGQLVAFASHQNGPPPGGAVFLLTREGRLSARKAFKKYLDRTLVGLSDRRFAAFPRRADAEQSIYLLGTDGEIATTIPILLDRTSQLCGAGELGPRRGYALFCASNGTPEGATLVVFDDEGTVRGRHLFPTARLARVFPGGTGRAVLGRMDGDGTYALAGFDGTGAVRFDGPSPSLECKTAYAERLDATIFVCQTRTGGVMFRVGPAGETSPLTAVPKPRLNTGEAVYVVGGNRVVFAGEAPAAEVYALDFEGRRVGEVSLGRFPWTLAASCGGFAATLWHTDQPGRPLELVRLDSRLRILGRTPLPYPAEGAAAARGALAGTELLVTTHGQSLYVLDCDGRLLESGGFPHRFATTEPVRLANGLALLASDFGPVALYEVPPSPR